MVKIIITLDYEIFGDGSGDIYEHIIKPTKSLLSICDQYGIKIVIMLEMMEYLKFKEYDETLSALYSYSPYQMITDQILEAYSNGHDVQLHVHPQWYKARLIDGKWEMENPYLSVTEMKEEEVYEIISLCKIELENLIRKVDPRYNPVAIRLTNLPWIEPPRESVKAISELGFNIHSLAVTTDPHNTELGYWKLSDTLLEMPILAISAPGYKKFTYRRIVAGLYRKIRKKNGNAGIPKKEGVPNFISKYNLKWDFCKQSCKEMIKFMNSATSQFESDSDIHLIMIGHSKDFFNEKEFSKFIAGIRTYKFSELNTDYLLFCANLRPDVNF